MVAATLDIYNTIADNLLPTPAKSHYTFNLRDLSKVFQVRGAYTLTVILMSKDHHRFTIFCVVFYMSVACSDPRVKHTPASSLAGACMPSCLLFHVEFSTPNSLDLRSVVRIHTVGSVCAVLL